VFKLVELAWLAGNAYTAMDAKKLAKVLVAVEGRIICHGRHR